MKAWLGITPELIQDRFLFPENVRIVGVKWNELSRCVDFLLDGVPLEMSESKDGLVMDSGIPVISAHVDKVPERHIWAFRLDRVRVRP